MPLFDRFFGSTKKQQTTSAKQEPSTQDVKKDSPLSQPILGMEGLNQMLKNASLASFNKQAPYDAKYALTSFLEKADSQFEQLMKHHEDIIKQEYAKIIEDNIITPEEKKSFEATVVKIIQEFVKMKKSFEQVRNTAVYQNDPSSSLALDDFIFTMNNELKTQADRLKKSAQAMQVTKRD